MNLLDQSLSSEMNSDKYRHPTSNKNVNSVTSKTSETQDTTHNYMKQTLKSSQGITTNTGRSVQNKQVYSSKMANNSNSNSNSNQKSQGLATSSRNAKINQTSNDISNANQGVKNAGQYNQKKVSKSSDLVNSYFDENDTNRTNYSVLSKNERKEGN